MNLPTRPDRGRAVPSKKARDCLCIHRLVKPCVPHGGHRDETHTALVFHRRPDNGQSSWMNKRILTGRSKEVNGLEDMTESGKVQESKNEKPHGVNTWLSITEKLKGIDRND